MSTSLPGRPEGRPFPFSVLDRSDLCVCSSEDPAVISDGKIPGYIISLDLEERVGSKMTYSNLVNSDLEMQELGSHDLGHLPISFHTSKQEKRHTWTIDALLDA
jgi:hypothetical protein